MFQEGVPTILQEFVQPRVIDQDLLKTLIIDQGPKGEAGKLFLKDGVKLDEIKEIRIEFLNILNIDHLWVMPNLVKLKLSNNIIERIENLDTLVHLKELDLSFNQIRIIENLDNLTKLEVLLLYNNDIYIVERLDSLRELTILSIGNNAIEDWEHVLYLRNFKKLRSLNMSGNPCCEKSGYIDYVIAFIPQLIYYQYRMIRNEERKIAEEKHYRALGSLEETEAHKREELEAKEKYEEKLALLSIAYVEFLDGDYLFEKMFGNDREGNELYMVNEDTHNAYDEYRKSFTSICQELYEFGLQEHDKRMDEIKQYTAALNEGKEATQNQGRVIVDEVLREKIGIFANVKELLNKMTPDADAATVEDITQKARQISEEFNNMLVTAWTNLMSNEVALHEQIEDMNEVFRINMTDMVDAFLSTAQGYFSQLRNSEAEYNDTINGLVLYYISGFGDETKIPSHLISLCGDKDILTNSLATSHEVHSQIIDDREDSMVSRLKNWLEEYTEQLVIEETERNHRQVLEISHFADAQQDEFNSLQLLQQINVDTKDPEILAALEV